MHAFALVELSIVLAIIGLLVSGIIVGKGLIRASELRAIVTETNNFITAINSFKSQYKGLPGDIPNATKYWGIAGGGSGTAAACYTSASTNQKTCDGNGDGQVYYTRLTITPGPPPSNIAVYSGTGDETTRSWQHLSNAGFINGFYSGTGSTRGISFPASRVLGAGYKFGYWVVGTPVTNLTKTYDLNYNNALNFTGSGTALLSPDEAYSLDTKTDDGLPASGNWIATSQTALGSATACSNSANSTDFSAATNAYNLARSEKTCGFDILTGN
jgi:type II secretory pathway pseudopilin PulG